MSISGPFGPIFQGVWQSWHPMMSTRYLPRRAEAASGREGGTLAVASTPVRMTALAKMAVVAMNSVGFIFMFLSPRPLDDSRRPAEP